MATMSRRGQMLLKLARSNPWAFFNVGELVELTRLPPAEMTRLRRLADRSPKDSPWRGDFTRLNLFLTWYSGKRRELESSNPDV